MHTFQSLLEASQESNPHITPVAESLSGLFLGRVSRAYTSWSGGNPRLQLFLNGEILYIGGQPTQRQGTTEAELAHVAALYGEYGARLWEHLDGNFCLVIRDGDTLRIGVDPVGTRAVYWWVWEDTLAFHSHFMDLAPCYPGHLTEDHGTIGNFLACGAYPPGGTAFREIHHLSPGSHLEFQAGQARVADHFRLECNGARDGESRDVLMDELSALLSRSIESCWRAAKSPVVPLSGGVDSRYITAELAHRVGDKSEIRTITWGERPERAGSDAVVAVQVAERLGLENVFHENLHNHLGIEWERALYLSSGEADVAVEYPNEHLFHQELALQLGFESLFRGDECYGRSPPLLSRRALLPVTNMVHLSLLESSYAGLLDQSVLQPMIQGQSEVLAALLSRLTSPTPTGRRDELYYAFRMRQVLAVYNRVKHAYQEVYNPHLARFLLDWMRGIPDSMRDDKILFRETCARNFPEIAAIPLASTGNLADWEARFQRDRSVIRFYYERCDAAGWLDRIGQKGGILGALRAIESHASAPISHSSPPLPKWRVWTKSTLPRAKSTLPGRFAAEMMSERRRAARFPRYPRIGRITVLHSLLGNIYARRAQRAL
jgi:hypothetical protein